MISATSLVRLLAGAVFLGLVGMGLIFRSTRFDRTPSSEIPLFERVLSMFGILAYAIAFPGFIFSLLSMIGALRVPSHQLIAQIVAFGAALLGTYYGMIPFYDGFERLINRKAIKAREDAYELELQKGERHRREVQTQTRAGG